MAVITDYTSLVQAIKDKAEDDGVEFSNYIPIAIDLAEDKIFREIDLPELEETATGSLTQGSTTLAKPTGYRFADYFSSTLNNVVTIFKKKTPSYIADYWPNKASESSPKYYSDEDALNFTIAPTPSAGHTYTLRFTKIPTKLSVSNLTNYYTSNVVDILFALCMIEMVGFQKAWTQLPIWQSSFLELRDTWNLQMMRYRRDSGVFPLGPASGPNTLKHTIPSDA